MPYPLPIVNLEYRYNLFWSAKCGSAAASFIFLEHCGLDCDNYPSKFRLENPKHVHQLRHTHHIHECRLAYNEAHGIRKDTYHYFATDDAFKNLKIVRNPFTRVVSGFLMFMRHATALDNNPSNAFDRKALALVDQSISEANKTKTSELSFLDFCTTLSRLDIARCNPHFLQQTHPLEEKGAITIDRVLKLETITADLEGLIEDFGYKLNYQNHFNKTYLHYTPQHEEVCELKNVASLAYGEYANKTVPTAAFYNHTTRALIAEIYHEDLRRYDYGFPY